MNELDENLGLYYLLGHRISECEDKSQYDLPPTSPSRKIPIWRKRRRRRKREEVNGFEKKGKDREAA